jgi:hypothetical protein
MAVEFEREFQNRDFYVRSDIVVHNAATGMLDIYEIKSAASVKEEHYDDVAFQRFVAAQMVYPVGRCFLITMNGEYVRHGDIDPEQLFVFTDVTDIVNERQGVTRQQAIDALAYLDTVPVPALVDYCIDKKLDCRFIKLFFPDLPDYTVFDIAFLQNEKRRELLAEGIVAIKDVPDDFPLSPKQKMQVTTAKSGSILIDHEAIAERMSNWEYPLHFLDYETLSYAIPLFDGVRPFQQMCFQYSLHTIDARGAEPRHAYFLSHGDDGPPRSVAASLKETMAGKIGTVFVWYEAFEKGRNAEMATMFAEYSDFFEEVNRRTVDLMKFFSDDLYIHPDFKGRRSIKNVLPVLVPGLSYSGLNISDGITASISWYRAVKWDTMDTNTRERIFADLEKYCKMDTLAMVRIFGVLSAISDNSQNIL